MKTYILLIIMLITGACTPMTKVLVLKPPKINIKNINKVAVIKPVTSVDYSSKIAQHIRQRLIEKLKKNTTYQYLDPGQIDTTLEKEKFKEEDYQKSSYAGRIARVLGVDTLIYATILAYDSSDEVEHIKGERDPTTGERLFQDRLKFIRRVDVAIKFEIASVNEDKPVSKTISAEALSDEEGGRDSFAKEALQPESELFEEAMAEVTASLIALIAPHYVDELWPIKYGEHPKLQKGIDSAGRGELKQAGESWQEVLDDKNAAQPDKDAAMFNLGLLAESQQQFDKAQNYFQKLFDKNHDSQTEEILQRLHKKEKD